METSQYYKPTLVEEKPLPLEEDDIAYAKELLDLTQHDGFIPLKLEEDVVVQRISHDLYAKPESGFRELTNNEIRACKAAERTFGAKPSIVISLDPSTRHLEIRGKDSTGLSVETFKNVYTVIGRSSNFSGEEIGQFGFGRIAYCSLSDIMILETKYRTPEGTTGEYAIMGKNGVGFNVLPKPHLDSYGTVVKLVLKREVNLPRLVDYIREACAFSGVPTYLNLSSDIRETEGRWRSDEIKYPMGLFQLNRTFQEKAEEVASKSFYYHGRKKGGDLVKSFHIVIEGAELYGEFRVGESNYYDNLPRLLKFGKEERLIGSPIEIGIDLPFSYYVINVLNERKFSPTADRERLREDSTRSLREELKTRVSEEISSFLSVEGLEEYLSLDEKTAAVFLTEKNASEEDPTSVSHFLSEKARRIRALLLQEVKVYKENENSRRYDRRNLASVLTGKNPGEIFFAPTGTKFSYNQIEQISQQIPGATFIQILPSSRGDIHDAIKAEEILREEGILSTGEYVTTNRDKLKRNTRKKLSKSVHIFESIEGYYSWGRFAKPTRHIESVDLNQTLPTSVIRVPKGHLRKYSSLLSRVKTSYKLVREQEGLKGGERLEDFVTRLAEKVLLTSSGTKKLKDLLVTGRQGAKEESIHLYLYSDQDLAKHFGDSAGTKIFNTEDRIFEVALFLTYHSRSFTLDTEMARLFDCEFEESRLSFSRRDFLHDYAWEKMGDSEILGSVMQVLKEIDDESINLLFARAVQGSKDHSEVASMRRSLLARLKVM